jgi:uncharacterized protein
MSTGPLPRHADIRKFVSSGAVLEGSVTLASLDRVGKVLAEDSGEAFYRLEFGVSEEGISIIEGSLRATARLQCQRCLESMDYSFSSTFVLGVVLDDEQARLLPKRMEPLLLEEEWVDTQAVIEDELLLCLPFVAYHPPEVCSRKVGYHTSAVHAEVAEEQRKNPFEALAALKKPD